MGTAKRSTYHHGNLREVLIDAAVELIAVHGAEKLSVREVAKLAGVSPGAPFRHFATRTDLLTAVAEQASRKLRHAVEAAMQRSAEQPALLRFAAIGHAYLQWAKTYPTHFRVVSDRALTHYASSACMQEDNLWIRSQMGQLLENAWGPSTQESAPLAQMAARALVYGLARMNVDGHFPEWSLADDQATAADHRTLDFFIALLQLQADAKTPSLRRP